MWDIDQLKASGFGIVRDELEAIDGEGIGGPVIRRVTAAPPEAFRGAWRWTNGARGTQTHPWQASTWIST